MKTRHYFCLSVAFLMYKLQYLFHLLKSLIKLLITDNSICNHNFDNNKGDMYKKVLQLLIVAKESYQLPERAGLMDNIEKLIIVWQEQALSIRAIDVMVLFLFKFSV